MSSSNTFRSRVIPEKMASQDLKDLRELKAHGVFPECRDFLEAKVIEATLVWMDLREKPEPLARRVPLARPGNRDQSDQS